MDRGVIERVLAAYGLRWRRILPVQKGYRNQSFGVELTNGRMVNLILYKTEPDILTRIKNANAVGDFLRLRGGPPVRHTHTHKVVRLLTDRGVQKYGALYNYLPGVTIPWEAYTRQHIKALGGTMSELHAALATHKSSSLPSTATDHLALNRHMCAYFGDPHVTHALSVKLATKVLYSDFTPLLHHMASLPGQQTLHMDFVRGNVLFTGTTITGVLDFEKTSRGHILFDIARTLAFLFVDCKSKQPATIRRAFLDTGYNKGPSTLPHTVHNVRLLEALVGWFLLYDFYKFLRHNPYESLSRNQHFVRTAKELRNRGIIG